MGRVMAGDFLEGVDKYLHLVAPEREEELSAAIRARAEELAEADKDMVVDKPSEAALGLVSRCWRRSRPSCRCSTGMSAGRSCISST